ncbi:MULTISPECIES: ATP-binding cassette domain-containing protein [unclassified Kitasatospora]|uniref:ATP-binding cassette domain-containing protein n=1 Tax=unclassified Kitasatospora TaxID=2633591 RepID=UPI00070CF3A8|nr:MULTISPECIES: ATP-binding cassette domain-containing protein [unclassified Kitasatospora]KQV13292.1 ABC transporter [Kitasatospora sp. Root107]KRB75260.1 ABC transporter [Kitasatospora sp. Root187]
MIETRGLRKSFQTGRRRKTATVDAVAGLDLTVAKGEIFGFLGPNGAGKTTTLRMLATLVRPDGGEAVIAGADLRTQQAEVRRNIGYIAQDGGTADDVTAREELVMQARMHGIGKAEAQSRAVAALDAFDLTEYADRNCRTYSGGQRRRVDIALGVIHRPKVLFLDEPTSGLDPQSRSHLWDEIRRLRSEGMTVFLTTHYLDEADALCDRIAIIDGGGTVAEGTPAALKRSIAGEVVTVGVTDAEVAAKASEVLAGQECVRSAELREDGGLRLSVDVGETAMPQIMRALADAGIELATIELHRPTLDDVFLAKTGRSLRES